MKLIRIGKPIWNGGKRMVGIAEHKIEGDGVVVDILYKNRFGERIYPHLLKAGWRAIKKSKLKVIRRYGVEVRLRLVPIDEMEVYDETLLYRY